MKRSRKDMEQKNVLLSALGIGVGFGAGLGFSSGLGGNSDEEEELWNEQVKQELMRQVIDGKECKETFQDFPYYLSESSRQLLMSAAFVHLKQLIFSRHIRNLPQTSRAILLSGPTELYLQTIAKALAHHFESKLLLLDIADFSVKVRRKYGCPRKESSSKRSLSEVASKRLASLFGSSSTSEAEDPPKNKSDMCMDEEFFMQLLYKVVVSVSEKSSIILYIRDVKRIFLESEQLYKLFQEILEKLSGPILILGSQITDVEDEWSEDELLGNEWLPCFVPPPEAGAEVDERLAALFPYNIQIKPPKDEHNLQNWKTQLEGDKKTIQSQDNQNHIAKVLAEMDVECKDLNSINHEDTEVLSKHIEEIAVSAVSYYLMNTKDPEYHNGKLVISSESLCHSLGLFRKSNTVNDTQKTETDGNKEVPPDNNYEANMRSELIPANQIGVTFADIGALEEVKESLQELIMLPLRRPELFKGGLLKPCRGILLFGPPGTGKTMLAKAIAHEAGASFINVPMSAITSKFYGEDEKNVRAIFTLAAKVSPTIIFIDEVDSLLGQRARCGEHEATRRIKNEFMTHWDGLLTKQDERILVLAATNRPFDLDDAIIRRFQRNSWLVFHLLRLGRLS
ncbi:peroxisomal biogenesis factor 6 isoform X2 [Neltuma alba]|uniref:peroxisomal biogenesis factor 6 isoform X2 n=1 Tax=Neltuma alba TaxID=207710 RepID=UPI0010A4EAE7|nr:peroxisomal biogenesis factor 6-like isoform X2 [Prosopis alba]